MWITGLTTSGTVIIPFLTGAESRSHATPSVPHLAAAGLMCRDNRQYSTYKADVTTTSTYPKNMSEIFVYFDIWMPALATAKPPPSI